MSWTLENTTLPNPHGFGIDYVTKSTYHDMINGASKRDVHNIKKKFYLEYKMLTQAQALELVGLFTALESGGVTSYTFSASQGSLEINETEVHLDITKRAYNTPGGSFREDITLILTEVE